MNEDAHRLMNALEMQGDKQGRAEEERRDKEEREERVGWEGGEGFFFFAVGGLSVLENYAKQSVGKRKNNHPFFFFSLSL